MPNIITHTLFADEFLQEASPSLKEWLDPRKQLVEIGSNGPDFLFFHGLSPSRLLQKSELGRLGNTVHATKTSEFYQKALECIQKEKDKVIQTDMKAYVLGHLLHWCLDSTAHPYVYYRTGHGQAINSWWHHRFESLIDAILLKVKREQTIQEYRAYTITMATLEQVRAIARIYVPIAKDVYDVKIRPYQIKESLEDWTFVEKLFYDTSGKKFETSFRIERLFGLESMISGFFVPNSPEDPFDTMNLLHKEWIHPCDDSIRSTESFFDLYEKAMDKAFHVIGLFLDAVEDPEREEDFLSYIGNKDYNTGLDENRKMRFFEPVFE
ncbi:MAG TPA: hypothetical protein H9886_02505 [Candidatus Faecalicoccus intestinipullorum]|nr:hypothetical protein [Candidatus Faecalicoccus intestinipullorum]